MGRCAGIGACLALTGFSGRLLARCVATRQRARLQTCRGTPGCPSPWPTRFPSRSGLPQIAPVVSAGSAQSRADVLVIVMSAVLVLTGLQWLSLRPKEPQRVELEGEPAAFYAPGLPRPLLAELQW